MAQQEFEHLPTTDIVDNVLTAIDLHWDYVREEPNNVLQINSRDIDEDGAVFAETFTIQRIYDTAYYVKCDRSDVTTLFGKTFVNEGVETVEFKMLPADLEQGRMEIIHTDAKTGLSASDSPFIMDLPQKDPVARKILSHLQINLLSLLIGHAKQRDLFDPFIGQVKALAVNVVGPERAYEMWRD